MNIIIDQVFRDNNRIKNADKLYKLVKVDNPTVTKSEVKHFLSHRTASQIATIQHKTKSAEGHIVAFQENEVWQVDLFFMMKFERTNKGYIYMFVVVDVFTRRAYVRKQKTKDGPACAQSLKEIIDEAGKPRLIMTDNDTAFASKEFHEVLNSHDIAIDMNVIGDHNALGIIDNFARRIKYILLDLFTDTGVDNWIDHIDKIIKVYNNTDHGSLDYLTPNEAEHPENFETLYNINLSKSRDNKTVSDLTVGDKVRVRIGGVFKKGTDPNFSDEVYEVIDVTGTTISLNDGIRRKRDNLLKIPNETPLGSMGKNIIQQRKDQQKVQKELNRLLVAVNQPHQPIINQINAIVNPVARAPRIRNARQILDL